MTLDNNDHHHIYKYKKTWREKELIQKEIPITLKKANVKRRTLKTSACILSTLATHTHMGRAKEMMKRE